MKIEIVKINLNINQIRNSVVNLAKTRKQYTDEGIKRKMKKLNKEILQERSNEIHNFNYEIIGDYVNSNTKIKILHKECGNVSDTKPMIHLRGSGGCNLCYKSYKKTNEEVQILSDKIHNKEYLILSEYKKTDVNILIEHLKCNTKFYQTPYNHLKGYGCPNCSVKKKYSTEEFQEKSNKIHNNEYEITGEYINSHTLIKIRHIECNSEFYQLPHNHINSKSKCPICSKSHKKSKDEFQEESNRIYYNQYELLSEYKTSRDKVKLKHLKCGKEFEINASYHLNGGICDCERENLSKGEFEIYKILKNNEIEFFYNKSIDSCKNSNSLRFDFYLPKYKVFIEFDGKQHYQPIKWFGGEKSYEYLKKCDNIKNNWCYQNNFELIRISYKDNIENKLNEIFNIY